jgi:hypothetical protein
MSNLSGPIIVEEDATHFLVGIHYNDRHLAREIDGRAWNGEKRRWTWKKNQENYKKLTEAFREIAHRFEISDKNLPRERNENGTDLDIDDGTLADSDWGFLPTTDNYLQFIQLQRIECKIDELLRPKDTSRNNEEGDHTDAENKQIADNKRNWNTATPSQAHEIIASITSDETFNELILRREANQSPIQRLHNRIRDEIKSFREVEDEEVHRVLTESFQKRGKSYERRELGLVQWVWFAEEGEFYGKKRRGHQDIYQMLHLFNGIRVAVEKYDQNNEEMSKIHAVLCLALGRIIWSKIRLSSTDEEGEKIELVETKEV